MSDVLTKFNPNNHKNLVDAFNEASEKFKDQVAYHCLGDNKTYAEIQTLAQHFAAFLSQNCGLKRGDAIAIQLPNITQYPVAFWGAMHAGIRVVNTNPLYTKREQIHQFNDSGATALVVLDSLLATTEQVLPETKIETVIIASMTDLTDLSATPAKAQEFKNVQSFGFLETLQQGAELPPCVVASPIALLIHAPMRAEGPVGSGRDPRSHFNFNLHFRILQFRRNHRCSGFGLRKNSGGNRPALLPFCLVRDDVVHPHDMIEPAPCLFQRFANCIERIAALIFNTVGHHHVCIVITGCTRDKDPTVCDDCTAIADLLFERRSG